MGLFDDTRTEVAHSALKMSGDGPGNRIYEIVYNHMVVESPSLPQDIASNIIQGLAIKAERFIKYGFNTYVNGLPEGLNSNNYPNIAAAKQAIYDDIYPEKATVYSMYLDDPSADFQAQWYLQNELDYLIKNGTFTYATITYTYDGAQFWGKDRVRVYYSEKSYTGEETPTYQADITRLSIEPWYHGIYEFTTGPNTALGPLIAMYRQSTPTSHPDNIPSLDKPTESHQGYFMPIVAIKTNNIYIDRDGHRESAEYITTKAILKKVGLTLESMTENLKENPDSDDLTESNLLFAANIYSENQVTKEYLYKAFVALKDIQSSDAEIYPTEGSSIARDNVPVLSTFLIEEQNVSFQIAWNKIDTFEFNETLGEVGTFHTQININPIAHVVTPDPFEQGNDVQTLIDRSDLYYAVQKTTTVLDVVRIHGLTITHAIPVEDFHMFSKGYLVDDKDLQKNFIFPLHIGLVVEFNNIKQEILMYDTMHTLVYAVIVTKLKWYEQGWFKIVLQIIMFVIAFFTAGASLVFGSTLHFATFALSMIVGKLFSVLVLPFLLKSLGAEGAVVGAVLMTVIGAFIGGGGSIDITGLVNGLDLMQMVNFATGLYTAYQQGLGYEIEMEMRELEQEQDEFNETMGDLFDGLEQTLDPMFMAMIRYDNNSNESPQDFFHRTTGITNPGVLCYEQIPNYVPNQLALPKGTLNYPNPNDIERIVGMPTSEDNDLR